MSSSQHRTFGMLLAGTALAAVGLAGCAGNGEGLNSNGTTGAGTTAPLTADFQSIQENVFTPICSPCHSGAGAPLGLMLDAAHSYADLVGVPSSEVSSFERVKPGDPDSSYVILKLTGSPQIVGDQMPRGETPLTPAVIAVIRQWIINGAPQGAQAAAANVNAMQKLQSLPQSLSAPTFAVSFTSPADASIVSAPLRHILVVFNHEVDASLINYTNLTMERVDSGQPLAIPTFAAPAAGNAGTVVITPVAPLLPGTYQVTARGSGGGALADVNAAALGGDYIFTFTVDGSP